MKTKRIACLSLAVIMIISLFGCAKNSSKGSDNSELGKVIKAELANANGNIKFICAGLDGKNNENHPFMLAAKKFKELYGYDISFISTGDSLWNDKFTASIASGEPIDGCFVTVEQYINFITRDYIQPLEDYMDLSKADKSAIEQFAKKDGKTYVAPLESSPYVIYYNKSVLENYGFDADEPRKLYEEGKWNWDTFMNICKKCYDPDNFVVGLENMFVDVYLTSNNASVLKRDDSGLFKLNMADSALKQTLEYIQNMHFKYHYAGGGYISGRTNFIAGNAAMCGAYSYDEHLFAEAIEDGSMVFEYGVAPFPYGPNNTEKINPAWSQGFAIATGSKVPKAMGKYFELCLEEWNKNEADTNEKLGITENQDFIKTLCGKINHVNYYEGIMSNGSGSFNLLDDVLNGGDINKKVGEYKPEYEKQVEEINAFLE
jgi:carbohydrate ABC transporter substrate-binding protein, CUT1 family (TC 3.A.1.1.-)